MDLHLDRVKNMSTTSWLVVAGATIAGYVFKGPLVAAAAGGAALYYVLQQTPCCAGCASGSGCSGANPNAAVDPSVLAGGS